ncbi:MAG: polyphenol oxidase family protein, partial [Candidatus Binataceae bacterium]
MQSHSETDAVPGAPRSLNAWSEPWFIHGFLGREGGVSAGRYRSLNLGYLVGDDRAAVDQNWTRVRGIVGEKFTLARSNQLHGATVHAVDQGNAARPRNGDGLVTATPGVLLCILTADCVPIHMIDSTAGVIGALHAGWRGIVAGIADAGIAAMTQLGAQPGRIRVAMGPSIRQC